jgi:hypothetical protein
VTILILLVLVVGLWIVVLAPSAWRHRVERQGVGSIDHFHHQLELLEHAGPKLVTPAYRLHTATPGGRRGEPFGPVGGDNSRPKLVLLRPTDDEESADVDGVDGCHYERVGVLEGPAEPTCPSQTWGELKAYRRQESRLRCTMLLRVLTAMAISTGLLGMVPTLRLAWIVTALSGLSALALVGLIAYAKEIEELQQNRRASRANPKFRDGPVPSAATAGYPGAWDEEYEFPQRAAAL